MSDNRGLNKVPHGSGSGDDDDFEYHFGKKEKIMIGLLVGFSILAIYYWFEIQHDLKVTDWTLDPNTNWTCHSLTQYEKMVEQTTNTGGFQFPRQLEKEINDKRVELGCQ